MSRSFSHLLKEPDDVLECFDLFADCFGAHQVEIETAHLAPAGAGYLRELSRRATRAKSVIRQVNVDWRDTLGPASRWIDAAALLGCRAVMVTGAVADGPVDVGGLGRYGAWKRVTVAVETVAPSVAPSGPKLMLLLERTLSAGEPALSRRGLYVVGFGERSRSNGVAFGLREISIVKE